MSPKRVTIVGAGPIGLEAALYARTLGYETVVYDQGEIASNVRSWRFLTLFSPWEMNTTPLGWKTLCDAGGGDQPDSRLCPTSAELLDRYLLPLATSRMMGNSIRTGTQVVSIERDTANATGFQIRTRDRSGAGQNDRADIVLDCSGVYTNHRWAGRGGIPAPGERETESRTWYTIPDVLGRDRARFIGRHTLVLGAGFSATTVLQNIGLLHRHNARTKASWAVRRVGQAMQALHNDPLPARTAMVKASMQLVSDPPEWLQYLGNCVLERIEDGDDKLGVTLKYMETDLALAVDEVVAMVGYAPDTSLYADFPLGRSLDPAGVKPASSSRDAEDVISAETLRNPSPNLYVLGAKSFGTNSNFLLQVGHKQVRDAFRAIHNDASLDLYRGLP